MISERRNRQNNRQSMKGETMATSPISGDFMILLRRMYMMSLEESLTGKVARHGINSFAFGANAAYVIAAASVEAFVNEAFLSQASFVTKSPSISKMPSDWIESIELSTKIILVPQLLFGRSFERDAQPYQDMCLLINIRNDMVHFKMSYTFPKYVGHLSERGIALEAPSVSINGADYAWPHKLSCTEGIRWAHNTACATILGLIELSDIRFQRIVGEFASNFHEIPESIALDWYAKHNIDVKSK